jgi:hypothetical protein
MLPLYLAYDMDGSSVKCNRNNSGVITALVCSSGLCFGCCAEAGRFRHCVIQTAANDRSSITSQVTAICHTMNQTDGQVDD